MRLLAVVALLVMTAGPALACPMAPTDPGQDIVDANTGFTVRWHFVPAQPKVGEFTTIEFTLCRNGAAIPAESLRIDAIMPLHRHGMNFQPRITALGDATFRAEGLMFHMPGTWQLIFEQRTPGGPARVTTSVEIE
jgi:hypothetical protein